MTTFTVAPGLPKRLRAEGSGRARSDNYMDDIVTAAYETGEPQFMSYAAVSTLSTDQEDPFKEATRKARSAVAWLSEQTGDNLGLDAVPLYEERDGYAPGLYIQVRAKRKVNRKPKAK